MNVCTAAAGQQTASPTMSGDSYAVVDLGAGVQTLVEEGNWYACSQQPGEAVSA